MKNNNKVVYFLFFISFFACSQQEKEALKKLEMEVIRETLPSYLDTNPNSIRNFLKKNSGYKTVKFDINWATNELKSETNGKTRKDLIYAIKEFKSLLSDSIQNVISKRKIVVSVKDSLYPYTYIPDEFYDIRNLNDWRSKYKSLKETFTQNKLVQLDTILGIEFIDLIRKQVFIKQEMFPVNLNKLNSEYYKFTTKLYENDSSIISFNFPGKKIYKPVFNAKKDKACYLFSYRCRNGICRVFIFVEKREHKWFYLASYSSHLIGKD